MIKKQVVLRLTDEQIHNLMEHVDAERAYAMDENSSLLDAWDCVWWQLAVHVGIEDPLGLEEV